MCVWQPKWKWVWLILAPYPCDKYDYETALWILARSLAHRPPRCSQSAFAGILCVWSAKSEEQYLHLGAHCLPICGRILVASPGIKLLTTHCTSAQWYPRSGDIKSLHPISHKCCQEAAGYAQPAQINETVSGNISNRRAFNTVRTSFCQTPMWEY